MPAKKITKEMIIDGAFNVMREEGFAAVNARSVAKKIGCSTQPLYLEFKNMDEIKDAMLEKANATVSEYVEAYLKEKTEYQYRAYGLGLIRFAAEEKQLFRYVYMDNPNRFDNVWFEDILSEPIFKVLTDEYGYTPEVATKIHKTMSIFVFGVACLINFDEIHVSKEEIEEMLAGQFMSVCRIYGFPRDFRRQMVQSKLDSGE